MLRVYVPVAASHGVVTTFVRTSRVLAVGLSVHIQAFVGCSMSGALSS